MEKPSCCRRLYGVVSGLCMEGIVAVLVVVDCLAITAELLIKLDIIQVPKTGSKSPDPPISAVQNASLVVNTTPTLDPDPGGSICRRCVSVELPMEITYCVVHYASVVISGLFLVEVCLRLVSGRSKVLKDYFQVFDSVVVVILVAMEILFTLFWDDVLCYHPAVEVTSYIVVFRLCRVPRACTVSKRVFSEKIAIEMQYLMKAKKKSDDNGNDLLNKLNKQQKEIDFLQNQLKDSTETMTISTAERGSTEFCNGHVSDGTDKSTSESNGLLTILNKVDQDVTSQQADVTSQTHSNNTNHKPQSSQTKPGINITIIRTSYPPVDEAKPPTSAVSNNEEMDKQLKDGDVTVSPLSKGTGDIKDSSVIVGAGPHGESSSLDAWNSNYDSSDSACLVDDSKTRKKVQRSRSDSALSTENATKIAIHRLDEVIAKGMDSADSGGIDNKSYESDTDVVLRRNLTVMAEYQGTRTYRSAEGVPLTDL